MVKRKLTTSAVRRVRGPGEGPHGRKARHVAAAGPYLFKWRPRSAHPNGKVGGRLTAPLDAQEDGRPALCLGCADDRL